MTLLFGPNKGGGTGLYENITTNGQCLFQERTDAQAALRELLARKDIQVISSCVRHVELCLTESEDDLMFFHDKKRLVVVMRTDMGDIFLGRVVGKGAQLYPIPADKFFDNGFKPFLNFQDARYVAGEVNRQGQTGAAVGTFLSRKV